jgi:hypothetical protein
MMSDCILNTKSQIKQFAHFPSAALGKSDVNPLLHNAPSFSVSLRSFIDKDQGGKAAFIRDIKPV